MAGTTKSMVIWRYVPIDFNLLFLVSVNNGNAAIYRLDSRVSWPWTNGQLELVALDIDETGPLHQDPKLRRYADIGAIFCQHSECCIKELGQWVTALVWH